MTRKFTPNSEWDDVEIGEATGNGFRAVAKCENGRFMVVSWNAHHRNWVRQNRSRGGAIHRNLDVLRNDGLEGGPVYMSLYQARDEVGIDV